VTTKETTRGGLRAAPRKENHVLSEAYPRSWRWDVDGPVAEGEHVRFDEAAYDGRMIGIHVLRVGGEERSIWAGYWQSLAAKIGDELARRPSGDLDVGERVRYERGELKAMSSNGRTYWPFAARFGNRVKHSRRAAEIFKPSGPENGADLAETVDEARYAGADGITY
jgi:hypothetical protein